MSNPFLARPTKPLLKTIDLFHSDHGGYAQYRIPGIAITPRGTILVTCDGRKDPKLGDWCDIDLFIRRSPHQGRTWEPPRKLVHRGLHRGLKPEPNPAAVDQGLGAKDQFPFHNQTLIELSLIPIAFPPTRLNSIPTNMSGRSRNACSRIAHPTQSMNSSAAWGANCSASNIPRTCFGVASTSPSCLGRRMSGISIN